MGCDMSARTLLEELRERGVELVADGEQLLYRPRNIVTPELAAAIKEHKAEILRIVREDEEMRHTGIIQSERQVFEMAQEFFGLDQKGGGGTQIIGG
jgi:hypothetical protein